MSIAGIDGCRKGWIMIKYRRGEYSYGVYEDLEKMIIANGEIERMLIDMPVGLTSKTKKRTIDALLRSELKGRASTVFNAPCRAAVYIEDPEKSKQKNIEIEGKSLSIQSLSLNDKIKQIDKYLQNQQEEPIEIIESHPELCFKYLNENHQVLISKKSTIEGLKERLFILKKYEPAIGKIFDRILRETKRKDVKKDDIVDALCLCVVNKLGDSQNLSFLVDDNRWDSHGIEMRIGFYK